MALTEYTMTVRVRRTWLALAYLWTVGGLLRTADVLFWAGSNPRPLLRLWDHLAPFAWHLLVIEQQTARGWERL